MREQGFYWVRLEYDEPAEVQGRASVWTLGEWSLHDTPGTVKRGYWYLTGSQFEWQDHDLAEIDPRRVTRL